MSITNNRHDNHDNVSECPPHGGEIERIAREYNLKVEELIDFSANINPGPPPRRVLERLARDSQNVGLLASYPDPDFYELRRVLAAHHDVQAANFVIANGSAALIDAAVRAVAPHTCLLPVPAFSEYTRALQASHCQIKPFQLGAENNFRLATDKFIEQLKREQPELCLINNPHNPSGAMLGKTEVEKIVRAADRTTTVVLLDEAFIDYAPEESLTGMINDYQNLIVLRSVTKFYAIPALRIGYAIASAELAAKIKFQLPSWSVTTLAVNAVIEAVPDKTYAQQTRRENAAEKKWLERRLTELGVKTYPSAANFLLLAIRAASGEKVASPFHRLLVTHRVIVRDCSTYQNLSDQFIRVAVRSRRDNEKLVLALTQFLQPGGAAGGRSR